MCWSSKNNLQELTEKIQKIKEALSEKIFLLEVINNPNDLENDLLASRNIEVTSSSADFSKTVRSLESTFQMLQENITIISQIDQEFANRIAAILNVCSHSQDR